MFRKVNLKLFSNLSNFLRIFEAAWHEQFGDVCCLLFEFEDFFEGNLISNVTLVTSRGGLSWYQAHYTIFKWRHLWKFLGKTKISFSLRNIWWFCNKISKKKIVEFKYLFVVKSFSQKIWLKSSFLRDWKLDLFEQEKDKKQKADLFKFISIIRDFHGSDLAILFKLESI